MLHYYNEINPGACQWLRNLMAEKLIPKGYLDTRSIKEVDIEESTVSKYTQAHFFSGIGGWPLALELAGWSKEIPIWSGSCPCPPFSSAGKKKTCPKCNGGILIPCPVRSGYFVCCSCQNAWLGDERHLWPDFRRLIALHRPATIIGEQVASKDGLVWFSGVRAGLEALGYAVGGTSMCAPATRAPHIRQRIFWIAIKTDSSNSGMAHSNRFRLYGRKESNSKESSEPQVSRRANTERCSERVDESKYSGRSRGQPLGGRSNPTVSSNSWSDYYIVECENNKRRRIGTGVSPLAYRIPAKLEHLLPRLQELSKDPKSTVKTARRNRITQIQGYGNAIIPQLGALFIKACMDILF